VLYDELTNEKIKEQSLFNEGNLANCQKQTFSKRELRCFMPYR